jgi:2-polyprenyl-3-methyl-5-hydroxy-6-metoxy-1,4-benzoquinol methylase
MTAPCPACGSEAPADFATTDRNRRLGDRGRAFTYHRCGACGLIFLGNVPELGAYYPPSYYNVPAGLEALETLAAADRYKIEIVRQYAPTGRLLEIGPAYGAFALLAKRAGYNVACIEYDAACVSFLRNVVGVEAILADDPAATLRASAERFDVICLWQNLEHLPNCRTVVDEASKKLAPGGVLIVATPNPDALQFRIFRGNWTHVDAPRHLALIPMPLLRAWGRANGLSPALFTTTDRGSRGWNRFGWEQTLANFASARALSLLLRLCGLVLTIVAAPLEWTGTRGACYTAVLRKDAD